MAGSYRNINYGVRPAKAIERRMLSSLFERLHPFQRVHNYRYIGFGSIYFTDFQLFHRQLGITDMLSIERDTDAKACFRFNRPYNCIRLKFASSAEVLPTITWRKRSIVWLDYDDKLNIEILGDIATVFARAASGSVIVISVNAQPDGEPSQEDREKYEAETGKLFDLSDYRYRNARLLIGDKVPAAVTGADLRGKGVARVFREVINNEILEQLAVRNATSPVPDNVKYQQLVHFRYRDGAQMLTVGGIVYRTADEPAMKACDFGTLPFVRMEAQHCGIKAPCLTVKEIRHLNSQLPRKPNTRLRAPGVPSADVREYAEVYRFFPTFSEILFA